jgi:hypothetical protein
MGDMLQVPSATPPVIASPRRTHRSAQRICVAVRKRAPTPSVHQPTMLNPWLRHPRRPCSHVRGDPSRTRHLSARRGRWGRHAWCHRFGGGKGDAEHPPARPKPLRELDTSHRCLSHRASSALLAMRPAICDILLKPDHRRTCTGGRTQTLPPGQDRTGAHPPPIHRAGRLRGQVYALSSRASPLLNSSRPHTAGLLKPCGEFPHQPQPCEMRVGVYPP